MSIRYALTDVQTRSNTIAALAHSVGRGQLSIAEARQRLRADRSGTEVFMQHAITDPKLLTEGNAIFTVSNGKGDHYTYRIRKPSEDTPYFAQMLTGPDNMSNYTYLGVMTATRTEGQLLLGLKLTAKSKMSEESKPVKVLRWALRAVTIGRTLPEGYAIQHEGRCCRCGRRLTDPDSITLGIGPECRKAGRSQ